MVSARGRRRVETAPRWLGSAVLALVSLSVTVLGIPAE